MTGSSPNPLDYHIRVSKRAKRVNLCIRPNSGLEIIVPQRFDRTQIPHIVELNRAWIERTLARIAVQQPARSEFTPPDSLNLRAIDRTVQLRYSKFEYTDGIRVQNSARGLHLIGQTDNQTLLIKTLESELKIIARRELPAFLSVLSRQFSLSYAKVTIRGQKSRWGSCSSVGNISLNYKLLFLPRELVRYVLLHELAHTQHLNHSPAYWKFLSALEPAAKALDRRLGSAAEFLPTWLD